MFDISALAGILEHNPASLQRITLAKPLPSAGYIKISIRPIEAQNKLLFHAEQFTSRQSFQRNFTPAELLPFLQEMIGTYFKFALAETESETITFLVNKKGRTTVLRKAKKNHSPESNTASCGASDTKNKTNTKYSSCSSPRSVSSEFGAGTATQNRRKKYLIAEGNPVPFLVQLGIMTKDGKVIAQKYDKFRQINRFLEYIDDILDTVLANPDGTTRDSISVIDFGCGKSYLTFAVYHYLTNIRGLKARVVGLDLKEEVIILCSTLAKEFGCSGLSFQTGDIASYNADNSFDLMITLHACDTATDYALAQAVKWQAKAVLSVPCCQHEVNQQLDSKTVSPQLASLLKYGIIKERFAALATDVMRAELLEKHGYSVQLLEFIDMTHTPKNVLIRAVKKAAASTSVASTTENPESYEALRSALAVHPTLETLL